METLKGLPRQIILTVENLKSVLEQAAQAETIEAARDCLAIATKLAEILNRVACEAQGAVDAEVGA